MNMNVVVAVIAVVKRTRRMMWLAACIGRLLKCSRVVLLCLQHSTGASVYMSRPAITRTTFQQVHMQPIVHEPHKRRNML